VDRQPHSAKAYFRLGEAYNAQEKYAKAYTCVRGVSSGDCRPEQACLLHLVLFLSSNTHKPLPRGILSYFNI
jgi:hypothetical protein